MAVKYKVDTGKRALLGSALFICLLTSAAITDASELRCEADRTDNRARVKTVYDGDTVLLENGEKIRLIGVNTPEMARYGKPAEPGAIDASRRLRQLLRDQGNILKLRFDTEAMDKYDRLLAHAFLDNGQSVTAWLLQQGLGVRISIPPNLWNLSCYRQAEQLAREAKRGLWRPSGALGKLPLSKDLPARTRGFRVVEGRVIRLGESRKSVWLNLSGRLSLRIAKSDLLHFRNRPPRSYLKKYILVRGWIYPGKRGSLTMRLRHPADIEILPYQLKSIPNEPQ